MNRKDQRTPLRKAVDQLIADGVIEQDKDLQAIFKLSKSTISAYLNGKPGKNFENEFQKKFELDLTKFEQDDTALTIEALSKYIIETHAMTRVLMAKLMDADSLKAAEHVTNRLLNEEREKNKKLK